MSCKYNAMDEHHEVEQLPIMMAKRLQHIDGTENCGDEAAGAEKKKVEVGQN